MLPLNSSPRFSARSQISPDGLVSGSLRSEDFGALWPENAATRCRLDDRSAFAGTANAMIVRITKRRIDLMTVGRPRSRSQQILTNIGRINKRVFSATLRSLLPRSPWFVGRFAAPARSPRTLRRKRIEVNAGQRHVDELDADLRRDIEDSIVAIELAV